MKLNEWMIRQWLIPVAGAEKYEMCQPLTDSQAMEIMLMIAESAELEITSLEERMKPLYRGSPYRTFIEGYIGLIIESGREDKNNWRKILWAILEDIDKMAIMEFAKKVYHVNLESLL